MAQDEAWNVLKSGNMPPPSPPVDPNDPDSPGNDDTTMDNTRNYWKDASRCPACEKPTTANHSDSGTSGSGTCETLGCPLSPIRQWGPEMEEVLERLPVQSGRNNVLPTKKEPATAGPDYDRLRRRRDDLKDYFRNRFRRG